MSQNEPKINPATGYVHDDSQLEEKHFEPELDISEAGGLEIEQAVVAVDAANEDKAAE